MGTIGFTFPNFKLWDHNAKEGGYKHANCLQLDHCGDERLGRVTKKLPFLLSGEVVRGRGEGKKLGFPTANLKVSTFELPNGVYAGYASLENGEEMLMVCSVGENVTFDQTDKTFEVHLVGKELPDFYGQTMKASVMFFLRPMLKFETIGDLVKYIKQDIDRALFHFTNAQFLKN